MAKQSRDKSQIRITPKKRVTMTDVAKLAECSQSTVSIVLNNTPGITIGAETRKRVMEAAEALGYVTPRPTLSASRSQRKISVVFDYLATSPEAIEAVDGVREAAWTSSHVVCAYQTMNDDRMLLRTLEAATGPDVDALIFATIMTREITVPDYLLELDIPVVLLNCYSKNRRFPSILPGEVAGGHLATRTLSAAGHTRIAHITGEMWMDASKSRLKGYRQALSSAEIPFDADLVRKGNWSTSSGFEHTKALRELPDPPTAIFCANDRMAIGAYEAIKDLGLRIPQDVSIIGYDDQEFARHLTPTLTTLILPHREMGRWALETALESSEINDAREHFPLVKLECTLVERDSISSPK